MIHSPADETRNGRHRAVCECGWQTHWCVTRDDAAHLAMRHADFDRHRDVGRKGADDA